MGVAERFPGGIVLTSVTPLLDFSNRSVRLATVPGGAAGEARDFPTR